MAEYIYGGAADIDRAIGYLVSLDDVQKNALAVLEIDEALEELQQQYVLATADPAYRPTDDFIAQLSSYLDLADDHAADQANN